MDLPQNTTYNTGGASQSPPKTPSVKAPAPAPKYFSGPDTSGNMWGFSDQNDVSGTPYLAYRTPGADATTTDPTRVATTFSPFYSAPVAGSFTTPRMSLAESSALKSQAGGKSTDELDHTIALELAGSNNPSNLRVESGLNTPGGESFGFDTLENSLRSQVASGSKSLFAAQLELAKAKANAGDKNPIPFVGAAGQSSSTTPGLQPDPASLLSSAGGRLSANDMLASQVLGTLKSNSNQSTFNPVGPYAGSPHLPANRVSSSGFNEDYIVPAYLGGANTVANREALPTPIFNNKATIQSVPYTLFSNGVITKDQAMSLALNWRNLSSVGIPKADPMGFIPVDTAKAIVNEWNQAQKGGGVPTAGSVLSSIPDAVDNMGKGVLPEWARQFLVGIASGATAGGVPLNNAPGATLVDKVSGLAGEALGMYGGIIALGGLGELAGAALGGLTETGKAIGIAADAGITAARLAEATGLPFGKGAGMAIKMATGDTIGGSSVFGNAAEELGGAAKASPTSMAGRIRAAISPMGAVNSIRNNMTKDVVGQALKNAALFGAYGQVGQTISDFTQPQKDALNSHITRLAQDISLGALVGAVPPTWKGAGTVGLGATMIGMFSGQGLKQSLSQGLAMAGLHKIGGFATDPAQFQAHAQQIVERDATKGALSTLHTIIGDRLGLSKIDPADPNIPQVNQELIPQWEAAAKESIDKANMSGDLTPEQYKTLGTNANMAIAWLDSLKLPMEQRDLAYVNSLSSMARYASERYDVNSLSTPNALEPFINKTSEMKPEIIEARPEQNVVNDRWEIADNAIKAEDTANRGVTGEVRATGQGANEANTVILQKFLSKIRSGEASATVFVVPGGNEIAFRNSNRGLTPEMLKGGAYPIDAENYLKVYGVVTDKATGQKQIVWTGTSIPQPERIGVVTRDPEKGRTVTGSKHAFNNDTDIVTGKYPDEDHNFNNKTIATAMRQRGLSALPMKIRAFKDQSLRADHPYMILRAGDDEWNSAGQIQGALGHPAELNTLDENIAAIVSQKGKSNIQPYLLRAADQLSDRGHTAATVVASEGKMVGPNEPRQTALFELDSKANEILSTATTPNEIQKSFNDLLGIQITPESAKIIDENRAKMTGGNLVTILDKAVEQGHVSPQTAAAHVVYIKPLLKSKTFTNSAAGMLHDKMPILSKPDVNNTLARKITGKGLLEQEPIKKPTATEAASPSLNQAKEDLQMVGHGTGRQFAQIGLDEYVDQLIKHIQESGGSPEEKSALGTEALRLINKEDLNARAISWGSTEAWVNGKSGQRPELSPEGGSKQGEFDDRFVNQQRQKIIDATDAKPPAPAQREKAAPGEREAIVRKDVTPYLEKVSQWKEADPTSYVRGHDQTFDELAKAAWGPDYKNNYGLMQLLSDKSMLGRSTYHSERVVKAGTKAERVRPPLMATETLEADDAGKLRPSGKQIGQPAAVVEAAPEGPSAVSAAYNKRNAEYKGAVQGASLPEGFHEVNPDQLPEENVQDLTQYEAELQKGLLDEERRGADPILSPKRGVEDATSQIFALVERYNSAVKSGTIPGSPVRVADMAKVKARIAAEIAKEGDISGMVTKAKDEVAKLQPLIEIGGTKARAAAASGIAANKKRISTLTEFIKKAEKAMGKGESDGQGGPGIVNDPASTFANLGASMAVLNPSGGGQQPQQQPQDNPIRMGPTTFSTGQPSPALKPVDLGNSQQTLADAKNVLANPPQPIRMSPTAFTSSSPMAPTPLAKQSSFLDDLKNNITNLMPANTGVYNRTPAPQKQTANPVIAGYDTSAYAEDPMHAERIRSIMATLPQINNANDVQSYIKRVAPKSPITGQMIMNTAQKYGVPASLIIATIQQDSSLGTLGSGAKHHNPGNVGTYTDKKGQNLVGGYHSWQAGVDAVGEWFANHSVQQLKKQPAPQQLVNQVVIR